MFLKWFSTDIYFSSKFSNFPNTLISSIHDKHSEHGFQGYGSKYPNCSAFFWHPCEFLFERTVLCIQFSHHSQSRMVFKACKLHYRHSACTASLFLPIPASLSPFSDDSPRDLWNSVWGNFKNKEKNSPPSSFYWLHWFSWWKKNTSVFFLLACWWILGF